MFEDLVLRDGVPIYRQLMGYLERGIAAGTIRDGEALPSRRVLSALLGVNPNTVQKAFRLLEEAGVVESRAGAGSVVRVRAGDEQRFRDAIAREVMRDAVRALRGTGLQCAEALAWMEALWNEGEEERI